MSPPAGHEPHTWIRKAFNTGDLSLLSEMKWKSLNHVQLFAIPWTIQSMEFSRPDYWVGSHSLLQGIFPTQGSNPGLPHCKQILYQLSHKGSYKGYEDKAIRINNRTIPGKISKGPAVQCVSAWFRFLLTWRIETRPQSGVAGISC